MVSMNGLHCFPTAPSAQHWAVLPTLSRASSNNRRFGFMYVYTCLFFCQLTSNWKRSLQLWGLSAVGLEGAPDLRLVQRSWEKKANKYKCNGDDKGFFLQIAEGAVKVCSSKACKERKLNTDGNPSLIKGIYFPCNVRQLQGCLLFKQDVQLIDTHDA